MENVAEASPPPGGPAPNPADPPSPTSPAEPAGDAAAPVEADEDNKTVFSEQTCLEEESLGDVTEGSTDLEAAGLDLDKLNAGSSSAAAAGSGAVAAGPGVTSSGSTVAAGLSAPASDAVGSSPMTSGPGSAVAEAARGSAEGPPANVALGATATTADPGPTTAASMALDGYDSKRDYQRKEDVRSDQVVGTGIREIGIVVDQEALMDQVVLVGLDRRLEARRPRLSLEKGAFANWLGWEVLERVKWRCDDERLLGSLRLFGPPFFTPWQRLTGPPLRLFAACGSLGRWALRLTGPPLLWVWQRLYGPLHRGSLGRCLAAALWAAASRLYGPLHRGSLGRCLAAALWAAASRLSGPLID
ncbi:unnamed protein product [Durusdinium trenchii]|uniref:Uncharacterized protein n=1 Tax=Durusdinium trenchii TaxID=1381693 RepID=A0ABP0SV80_9DINO